MLQQLHKKIGRKFRAGEYIFRTGDAGEAMFFVTEGRVSIRRCQNGKDVSLAELSTGEIFGEMAIIENRTRCADALCITDTSVFEISSYLFEKYVQENPAIVRKMLHRMSQRLRSADINLFEAHKIIAALNKRLNGGKSDVGSAEPQGVGLGSVVQMAE